MMYDEYMTRISMFFFCAFCLLLGTACQQQVRLSQYEEEASALLRLQRIIQSADKGEIRIVHVCHSKKITIPVPPEQLSKLKELFSHLRSVPPSHRAPVKYTLASARLEFPGIFIADSSVVGYNPSMDILSSITSETEAFAKDTSCSAPLYLPDAEWAAFEALPVIIRTRQTIARMDCEAQETLRQ